MANTFLPLITISSPLVDKLLDDMAAIPPLLNCRKCSTKTLHMDATFFTLGGKVRAVALPFCPQCDLNEETATYLLDAAGRVA
jgi:hypothetical protein